MREGENPEFTRRGNGSFSGGFRGRFSGWFQGVGKVCFRQAKQGVREGSARGVREGLTEGQFYERKGGAERRFSPVPDVRYRIWDRGCGGFGHFPRAHLSGTGKGERVRRVKIFFRVSPSARYLEAICGSARDSPNGNDMATRDERIPPTNIKRACSFLGVGRTSVQSAVRLAPFLFAVRGAVLYRPADCVRVCPRRGGWKRKQDAADPNWTPRGARTCAARKKRKKV